MSDRLCPQCGDYKELCGHEYLRDRIAKLDAAIEVATRMAQELQEFVDDAVVACGDENALAGVQALLVEWEEAFNALGRSDV